MKKTSLLNIALSETIAGLGHGDTLVISDVGLPVPPETRRIDLALTWNVPRFMETLRVVLAEMQVESVIMAKETEQVSPHFLTEVQKLLPNATIELVPHTTFKEMTREARSVLRTGDEGKIEGGISSDELALAARETAGMGGRYLWGICPLCTPYIPWCRGPQGRGCAS